MASRSATHQRFHLPNQQLITWNENNAPNVQAVVEEHGNKDTNDYLKANTEYPAAQQLLHQDSFLKFVCIQNI